MFRCPNCGGSMPTADVNDATHVALGEVVCSSICHTEYYSLERRMIPDERYQLPLHLESG